MPVFIICFISTMFGGVVTMLMSVYLPVTVKDLLGNVSEDKLNEVSAYINSLFIFGWMFGILADTKTEQRVAFAMSALKNYLTDNTINISYFVNACKRGF